MATVLDVPENAVTVMHSCIPDYVIPDNPSWDRAREFKKAVYPSAEPIIRLGLEIKALHEEHYAQGARNDKSLMHSLAPQAAQHCKTKGWQATVQEELGISPRTALRLIDKAYYVAAIKGIADGENVDYEDSLGKMKVAVATTRRQELAKDALFQILAGVTGAGPGWAGVIGEGNRTEEEGDNRGAIKYARNARDAITSFKTTFKHWPEIGTKERHEIEAAWNDLIKMVPGEWKKVKADV